MVDNKKSKTLMIGWVVLLLLGFLIAAGGVASLVVAYRGTNDPIVEGGLGFLKSVHPDLPQAIRGRRATAASLAISNGILLMWIAATAYRRAEKWAWYAILSSLGVGSLLAILRIPFIGTRLGAGTAVGVLVILLVALLVSYRDFK